jgi:hypothetical protein
MAEAPVTKQLTTGNIKPSGRRIGIELVIAAGGFIWVRSNRMLGIVLEDT